MKPHSPCLARCTCEELPPDLGVAHGVNGQEHEVQHGPRDLHLPRWLQYDVVVVLQVRVGAELPREEVRGAAQHPQRFGAQVAEFHGVGRIAPGRLVHHRRGRAGQPLLERPVVEAPGPEREVCVTSALGRVHVLGVVPESTVSINDPAVLHSVEHDGAKDDREGYKLVHAELVAVEAFRLQHLGVGLPVEQGNCPAGLLCAIPCTCLAPSGFVIQKGHVPPRTATAICLPPLYKQRSVSAVELHKLRVGHDVCPGIRGEVLPQVPLVDGIDAEVRLFVPGQRRVDLREGLQRQRAVTQHYELVGLAPGHRGVPPQRVLQQLHFGRHEVLAVRRWHGWNQARIRNIAHEVTG
mmetsp:Transcript_50166/g.139336  ORF Transcript_50166/g.139336 Transcript_50166/m.139336 type:complete len:352 (+) Transcript_50166:1300-2355(+)